MEKDKLSYETKTIITVILLVAVYPVGIFFMFKWMDWSKWVKGVVLLPLIIPVLAFIFILLPIYSFIGR